MRLALILGSASLVAGCTTIVPECDPPAVVSAAPESFSQARAEGEFRASRWWRSYEDPVLNTLVDTALDNNLDIGEAIARIDEVRARYARERAAQFPQLNAGVQANYSDRPVTGIGAALGEQRPGAGQAGGDQPAGQDQGEAGTQRFSFSTFTAQLELSYEADLWGRLRNQSRAALENYHASLWELQAVRISIASETMRSYFDLVESEQLRDLSAAQADILNERVSLAESAFLRGLASSFELISLRENLREAEAVVPQLEARAYAAKARLAVLVGMYPEQTEALLNRSGPLEVMLASNAIPSGLPAQLLDQRPDIRSARSRLDAARYGVGAAKAAQLPRLSLSGSGGREGENPGDLFDPQNWFVNLLGALTAPIFDAGRLGANVDISEAQRRQRAMAYGQSVLTAFSEVEEALQRHEKSVARVDLLATDLDNAREAAALQLRRFERGTAGYSEYLDARLNILNSRRSMVEAERALAEARLAVHRALGGDWTPDDNRTARPPMMSGGR